MSWPSGRELVDLIEPVEFEALGRRRALARDLPAVEAAAPDDPRLFALRGISASLHASKLAAFQADEIATDAWWRRATGKVPSDDAIVASATYYFQQLASTLVLIPFVRVEHELRRIVTAIDPIACKGGTDDFKNVYEWLLTRLRRADKWTWSRGDASDFFDLYRGVRNALVHHNGRWVHPRAQAGNYDVAWQGETYEFRHGADLAFADDADFVLGLVADLVDLTDSIVRSPLVSGLPPIASR